MAIARTISALAKGVQAMAAAISAVAPVLIGFKVCMVLSNHVIDVNFCS